jgi:very-short-patch-repair endonuclease
MPRKGETMGAEYREMMRQVLLKRWQMPGYRERLSEKHKGHSVSDGARQKIGDAHRGKPLTEEHRANMSTGSKRRWQDPDYASRLRAFMQSDEFKSKLNGPAAREKNAAKRRSYWAAMTVEERRERLSAFNLAGRRASAPVLRGKPLTAEHRAKLSMAHKKRLQQPEARAQLADRMAMARAVCRKVVRNTSLERRVRAALDVLGITYEPSKQIDLYEADFYLPEFNLILECDGAYWHSRTGRAERDAQRDSNLQALGYQVVRLLERDIRTDVYQCITTGLANLALS